MKEEGVSGMSGAATIKKEDNEDIDKVHDVWCKYLEHIKQNAGSKWNIMVFLNVINMLIARVFGTTATRTDVSQVL